MRTRFHRWAVVAATTATVLGTTAVGLALGSTMAAHATTTGTCTFNGVTGLTLDGTPPPSSASTSNVVPDVSPSSTISVVCHGLALSSTFLVAEASPLAGLLSSPTLQTLAAESDLTGGSLVPYEMMSDGAGNGTYTFTTPSPFVSGAPILGVTGDPNAVCPTTQTQDNVGLGGCALGVATPTGTEVSAALLEYGTTPPVPANPTLALGASTVTAGGSVSVSDALGNTSYWWGGYAGAAETIPAGQILIDGIPASASSVSVSAATYSGSGGTIAPQVLSGSFTVPSSVPAGEQTVEIFEASQTPLAGNSNSSSFPDYLEAEATINVTQLPPCTFNGDSASAGVTGVTPGASITVACTGLNSGDAYTLDEESPLAQVITPTSDVAQVEDTTDNLSSGALVGTTWSPTYVTLSGSTIGADPNSACPPTQAQIDAGLVDCTLNLVDTTAGTDFAGVPLQYAGQGSPAAPTLAVSPSTAGPGTSVIVSDATGSTSWWWGNAASTATIPKANVIVGGVAATSSTVEVQAAVYTVSAGAGTLTPPKLSGAFVAPSGTAGGAQTVTIYEPNDTAAAGNSTDSSFANFVAGSTSISLGVPGYWLVGKDGGIFTYGGTEFFGSCPQIKGGCPGSVVGMAPTGDGQGYWLVDNHGDIYTFGDAAYYGSVPGLGKAVANIVGIVVTADSKGYWLVGGDGGVFTFGDATFFGSCPQLKGGCPGHVVTLVPTADSKGYWLTDTHGDLYTFGDATYDGSIPGLGKAVTSIVSMARTLDGKGYWLVGHDGGVFTFGDAPFEGACGTLTGGHCGAAVVGMAPTPDGKGYWLTDTHGDIYTFGDAAFDGGLGAVHLNAPVVEIEAG